MRGGHLFPSFEMCVTYPSASSVSQCGFSLSLWDRVRWREGDIFRFSHRFFFEIFEGMLRISRPIIKRECQSQCTGNRQVARRQRTGKPFNGLAFSLYYFMEGFPLVDRLSPPPTFLYSGRREAREKSATRAPVCRYIWFFYMGTRKAVTKNGSLERCDTLFFAMNRGAPDSKEEDIFLCGGLLFFFPPPSI